MQHEWIRDRDGIVEHAVFTSQLDNTVVVSLDLMEQMLATLGFRRVDTLQGDVVASEDHTN